MTRPKSVVIQPQSICIHNLSYTVILLHQVTSWYTYYCYLVTVNIEFLLLFITKCYLPSFAASLEPLTRCWNVASLSLFYRYAICISIFYTVVYRCSSEMAQLVALPYSWGRSTCYPDRLHYLSVTILICCKDVYVNSFFPHTARLCNPLSIEHFPLTYDLSGFKTRINRHFWM